VAKVTNPSKSSIRRHKRLRVSIDSYRSENRIEGTELVGALEDAETKIEIVLLDTLKRRKEDGKVSRERRSVASRAST
jgi:hypothetical protein